MSVTGAFHASQVIPHTPTHLTITEVDERGLFPAGFEELGLEELPIKIHPRTTVLPGDGLSTRVICEQRHVHPTHEESRQLNPSGVEVLNLKLKRVSSME